jgi:23S rRNA (cytidine1920-2'-O)/16S rRNA (cytidine1409-2'-O)-methyltransferase
LASNKKRLDILLVEKGFFASRERAKRAVMAGLVFVDGSRIDKPGTDVPQDSQVLVKEDPVPYVGRGGLKMEKALEYFGIDVTCKTALDIGASTGGFTDCLLKKGAAKVFAIDVGYGQLDWKLRQDSRVVVMERTNIRYVKPEDIGELCDLAVIDVSFISLTLVLPVAVKLLKDGGEIVALIKPQFEAGREKVGKKGIVRDAGVHREVIEKTAKFMHSIGIEVLGLTYSPVTGADGNIEFLIYGRLTRFESVNLIDVPALTRRVVEESHRVHGTK